MHALVYHGPGQKDWEEVPGPILGHEAVGTVEAVGSSVKNMRAGDRVLVSGIAACGARHKVVVTP
jgi:alcohol dehydrogenase